MDRQELKDGIGRVIQHLIRPLENVQRYKRPRKVTEVQHLVGLADIGQRLAHLHEDELAIVRETVIEANRFAPTPTSWPTPGTVISIGLALRMPDGGLTDRVRNLIRWFADKGALPPEDFPWLLVWLRKNVTVPNAYQLREIAARAEADRRALARIREMVDAGATLTSSDAELRATFDKATADVAAILGKVAA